MNNLDDRSMEIYSSVIKEISSNFPETTMKLWINCMVPISIIDRKITLKAENDFKKGYFEKKYTLVMKEAFKKVTGEEYDIEVITQDDELNGIDTTDQDDFQEDENEKKENPGPSKTISEDYTFDNFVVGSSNQLAYSASMAVAKNPASLYNPLYLYGPSGLGKTHLLFSIFNYIKTNFKSMYPLYVTSEDFTNQIIEAIDTKTQIAFREKYRKADLLLIDDIQFIAGKKTIQEEFFHTFNALFEQKKQIVITSDTHPNEISHLEERLRSRFSSGLIADIQPPDMELRTVIFKKKAMMFNVNIPLDVLTYLSENIKENVRQIEGAIKTLKAHSLITGKEITLPMAKTALTDFFKRMEKEGITSDKIIDYICKRQNIKREDLLSSRRTAEIATARHVTIYLLRTLTPLSYKSIGKLFSKDHSTIITSFNNIDRKMRSDPSFSREINDIIKELKKM